LYNNKIILICGFARGGTNLLWNILQSHPDVVSPIYETGKLFNYPELKAGLFLYKYNIPLYKLVVDASLYRWKLKNLNHEDNKYAYENKMYTRSLLQKSTLCLKSVNADIGYTDLLLSIYPDLHFIGLTRNGYAVAEGHMRRGASIKEAAFIYKNLAEKFEEYRSVTSKFTIIKYEDLIADPFKTAHYIYSFVNASPSKLDKLRLKVKRVMKNENSHLVPYGQENRKYWFDEHTINNIIDPNVNEVQVNRLSKEQIHEFNQEAGAALSYFGYDILHKNSFLKS
jgi:hypothetical protein